MLAFTFVKKQECRSKDTPLVYRLCGCRESLVVGDPFQVKCVHVVYLYAPLSLQTLCHRSEHWVIIKRTAKVTVDDTISLLS